MAGKLRFAAASLAICHAVISGVHGQTAADTPAVPNANPPPAQQASLAPKAGKWAKKGVESPAFDNVRKALDALTPEQRKRFQENFKRWTNLSQEEKKALLDREELRKKFIAQEIEAAIKDSGLDLEGERHEQFVKRYAEERRKIEEQLRKEMNEQRKPLMKEMLGKLKQEFSNAPASPTIAQPN